MKQATTALAALVISTMAGGASAQVQSYSLDPNHTFPSVEFSHMGVSTWRGKFTKTSGKVMLDRSAKAGSVDVTIDPASIDFGHATMNGHARGDNWFKTEQFPTITYKGKLGGFNGDVPMQIDGELTMLGVTRPVTLQLASFKCIQHPMLKREMCGGDATGMVNRRDFNLGPTSGSVPQEIKLVLQVEGVRDDQ